MQQIRRKPPPSEEYPAAGAFKITWRYVFLLILAAVLLFSLNMMNMAIRLYVINQAHISNTFLYTALTILLPPLGFLLYAFISDKGYERIGFISGMGLFLAGIILAVLPANAQNVAILPLVFASVLAGSYTQFLMLTVPFYFLKSTKRPVFVSSIVIVLVLANSAIEWGGGFRSLVLSHETAIYVMVSAAILSIVFMVIGHSLFERYRAKTLAAALYALLHPTVDNIITEHGETPAQPSVMETLLTVRERDIALLLTEGLSQYEISRKLSITSGEVGAHIKTIQEKVGFMGDPDPVISAAAVKYKLTKRETDMLRCLLKGMSNDEIAAELFLSEETVKIHVRNLLKKINIKTRLNISEWLEAFKAEN
jgi:DNA-binding CsgD family transcriptional regulator